MNESQIISIIVNSGAVGLAFLVVWVQGKKIDSLTEALRTLTGEIRELIGHNRRGSGHQ